MQACSVGYYSLFFSDIFSGFLNLSSFGVLGFPELLKTLSYAPHQLRYFPAAKEKNHYNQYQNYFESTNFSHLSKYLSSCKFIKTYIKAAIIIKIFTSG